MTDNTESITPYLFPTSDSSYVKLVLDGGSSDFNDIFINFIVILIEGSSICYLLKKYINLLKRPQIY